jgi:hypothetical protein
MSHARYLDINMPERFVLECLTDTGAWIDWGLYHADVLQQDAARLTHLSATPSAAKATVGLPRSLISRIRLPLSSQASR